METKKGVNMTNHNQYNFQKLTPVDDIENLTAYEEALEFALENEDINNVAITGIYGSGKSSMLESFKNRDNEHDYKYIHISLSNFESTTEENSDGNQIIKTENNGGENLDNKTLEGKILNQLLHQINPKNIPQTIFKLKRNVTIPQVLIPTLLTVFTIILLIYLWNYEVWGTQEYSSVLTTFILSQGFRLFLILVFIVLISFVLYKFIELQYNRRIIKNFSFRAANFQSDVNVFEDSKESYFDKYLDDVIYLFENSEANVIVFEDIDRFDNNVIFAKLKEINTLVNNNKDGDTQITFIYMLKDDMFFSKDRTKFFDFIIPIIPIINSSNSYDKLKKILNKQPIANLSKYKTNLLVEKEMLGKSLFNLFDNSFLLKLSLYIDDMRLLMNVVNEFIIYFERINSLKLDINKFFAIIVYKNVFPNDFANFQLNRGFVFHLFNSKDNYISDKKFQLENDIQEIKQKIEDSEKEILESKYELFALYFKHSSTYYQFRVNKKFEKDFETRAEFIQVLIENDYQAHYKPNHYNSFSSVDLTEEFVNIEENPEFKKRLKNIQNSKNDKISHFHEEKESLESEKRTLSELKLREIIKREDIESASLKHFTGEENIFEEIKKNPYFDLLIFLITSGYIDEDYSFYLTYFHSESLTVKDQEFLRGILDHRRFDYDYQLTNFSEIYNRLESKDFQKIEALNFDLFEYILNKKDLNERNEVLNNYFKLIGESNSIDFFIEFYLLEVNEENTETINELLKQLYINLPSIFKNILTDKSISTNNKNKFVIDAFSQYNEEELNYFLNNQDVIQSYIENSVDLLYENDEKEKYVNQFMNNLESWQIKFKRIDFEKINSDLGSFIYRSHLYAINEKNIQSILQYFYDYKEAIDFKHKNYTLIYNSENTPLKKYIEENLNEYLIVYLGFAEGIIMDDLELVYIILDNEKIDFDIKLKYISALQEQKMNLSEIIDEDLYATLVTENILNVHAENILIYYKFNNNGWTVELIDFLYDNSKNLQFSWPHNSKEFDEKFQEEFYKSTIKEDRLDNVSYEEILSATNLVYTEGFALGNLSDEKISILIKLDIIKMTTQNLITVRSDYPNLVVIFILENLERYLDLNVEDNIYDYNELLEVLDSLMDSEFSIGDQKRIVDAIHEPISIEEKTYKVYLLNYILKTKFDVSDLSYLIANFESFTSTTQKNVINIVSSNIEEVINLVEIIPKALLNNLLKNKTIDLENRQVLFSRNINEYANQELKVIFELLELNKYVKIVNQNRRNVDFKLDDINANILKALEKRELISSYSSDGSYYKVNSKEELNLI